MFSSIPTEPMQLKLSINILEATPYCNQLPCVRFSINIDNTAYEVERIDLFQSVQIDITEGNHNLIVFAYSETWEKLCSCSVIFQGCNEEDNSCDREMRNENDVSSGSSNFNVNREILSGNVTLPGLGIERAYNNNNNNKNNNSDNWKYIRLISGLNDNTSGAGQTSKVAVLFPPHISVDDRFFSLLDAILLHLQQFDVDAHIILFDSTISAAFLNYLKEKLLTVLLFDSITSKNNDIYKSLMYCFREFWVIIVFQPESNLSPYEDVVSLLNDDYDSSASIFVQTGYQEVLAFLLSEQSSISVIVLQSHLNAIRLYNNYSLDSNLLCGYPLNAVTNNRKKCPIIGIAVRIG